MHPKTMLAKRLKEVMDERSTNAAELARETGVKKTFLYDVLSGKSLHPSSITLSKVASHLRVPLAYLTGTEIATPSPQPQDVKNAPFVSVKTLANGMGDDLEYYYFRRSWIRTELRTSPEDLRLIFIQNDSMAPTLEKGDQVLINTADTTPSPSGIFVMNDGKQLIAKRLELLASKASHARVLSDNPKYRTYECAAADLDIVGRIVWLARTF
jgi:transcriptional regulator with XRE-family HTH domain